MSDVKPVRKDQQITLANENEPKLALAPGDEAPTLEDFDTAPRLVNPFGDRAMVIVIDHQVDLDQLQEEIAEASGATTDHDEVMASSQVVDPTQPISKDNPLTLYLGAPIDEAEIKKVVDKHKPRRANPSKMQDGALEKVRNGESLTPEEITAALAALLAQVGEGGKPGRSR